MTSPDLATVWHAAMKRARTLQPDRIARAVLASADNGLRAARFDADGGRTSRVPCVEDGCPDGKPGTHSHHVVNDPTGNAATRGRGRDSSSDDLRRLNASVLAALDAANVVLDFVCQWRADSWAELVNVNAKLMPGTVQAGLDVDDDYRLPPAITAVDRAVAEVERIAREYLPRTPSQDEQHWTSGLAPEDCCRWHYEVEPAGRYKRPRVGGTNVCGECAQIAEWAGCKPPLWFMDALIEKDAKPKAYDRALSRLADELEVPPHRRVG